MIIAFLGRLERSVAEERRRVFRRDRRSGAVSEQVRADCDAHHALGQLGDLRARAPGA